MQPIHSSILTSFASHLAKAEALTPSQRNRLSTLLSSGKTPKPEDLIAIYANPDLEDGA